MALQPFATQVRAWKVVAAVAAAAGGAVGTAGALQIFKTFMIKIIQN